MEMLIGLELFLIFIVIGFFIIWVWALIDIITSKFQEDIMQVVWLLVVFFLPFIGVLLYLMIGRSMKLIPKLNENDPADKYDLLAKIKALLDEGVISDAEFEAEKQKILNG